VKGLVKGTVKEWVTLIARQRMEDDFVYKSMSALKMIVNEEYYLLVSHH
jgi:hypothetical protein